MSLCAKRHTGSPGAHFNEDRHGEDGSVAQALSSDGPEIINKLIADGLITNQDRPELFGEDGAVNEKGRALVRDILIGKMFRDGDQLAMTQSGLKGKLGASRRGISGSRTIRLLPGFISGTRFTTPSTFNEGSRPRDESTRTRVRPEVAASKRQRFSDDAIALARVLQQGRVNAAGDQRVLHGGDSQPAGHAWRSVRCFRPRRGQASGVLQGGPRVKGGPLAMAEDAVVRTGRCTNTSTLADHDLQRSCRR